MDPLLERLTRDWRRTEHVPADARSFLLAHKHRRTAEHCAGVAAEARQLATQFGAAAESAETAGWLHDISVVFCHAERVSVALRLGLGILPEERAAPMILHQRLSAVLAREVFAIQDQAVLSAIECHTTLKAHASALDKVVFLADKIAWDQRGSPPYLEGCLAALESAQSGALDRAVLHYLNYLWERQANLPAVHPWFTSARHQLLQRWSPALRGQTHPLAGNQSQDTIR